MADNVLDDIERSDNAMVTPVVVVAFLEWYRELCGSRFRRFDGIDELWWNALHSLTMGELRKGARWLMRQCEPTYIHPPTFWQICKAPNDEVAAEHIRQLRKIIKRNAEKRRNA